MNGALLEGWESSESGSIKVKIAMTIAVMEINSAILGPGFFVVMGQFPFYKITDPNRIFFLL